MDWQDLTKDERIQKYIKNFPNPSKYYKLNRIKEELVLRYVSDFQSQYKSLFPLKPSLLLSPKNEYSSYKFICTFIKPTILQYDQLYYYQSCSKFISDHIHYEKRENNHIPNVVCSPNFTLSVQKGDCFDMSILLTSLLIGTGYNCYCVYGYAKQNVTENCTKNNRYNVKKIIEVKEEKVEKEKIVKKTKYKLNKRPELNSKFLIDGGGINMKEKEDEKKKSDDGEEEEEETMKEKEEDDEKKDEKRMHCWVLLLPDKRDIEEPLFIETSSGEVKSVNDKDYFNVISVFNHENYWVNMQGSEEKISYKLDDNMKWENIFLSDKNDDAADQPFKEEVLDVPLSWCDNLFISKKKFLDRYPLKTKEIEYKNVRIGYSSPFYEKDLSVKRIFVYENENSKKIKEKHVFFEKRKDKLMKRSVYYNKKSNEPEKEHEWFLPGRKVSSTEFEGLSEILKIKNEYHEYMFYSKARIDCLRAVKFKFENVNGHEKTRKIEFTYVNRGDKLIYRSITYDNSAEPITVRKKTEKFERSLDKHAEEDVEKILYHKDRFKVFCHFGDDKITRSTKEFTFAASLEYNIDTVSKYSKQPTFKEVLVEFEELSQSNKICEDEIKSTEEKIKDILERRKNEEISIKFETNIYDTFQNQPTKEELEEMKKREYEEKEIEKKKDLLSSYIPPNGVISNRQVALDIFNSVLQKRRTMLLTRTKIMEQRLKEEKTLMNKKRIQYQKQDTGKKEEEFIKFWEKTMFRMRILKQRCELNQIESKREYEQLQITLLNDIRLKEFLKEEREIFYSKIHKK